MMIPVPVCVWTPENVAFFVLLVGQMARHFRYIYVKQYQRTEHHVLYGQDNRNL